MRVQVIADLMAKVRSVNSMWPATQWARSRPLVPECRIT
jgi:hypothetical protein